MIRMPHDQILTSLVPSLWLFDSSVTGEVSTIVGGISGAPSGLVTTLGAVLLLPEANLASSAFNASALKVVSSANIHNPAKSSSLTFYVRLQLELHPALAVYCSRQHELVRPILAQDLTSRPV